MYIALHVKYRSYSCQILIKPEFSRQIFEKSSNIIFNENPSSGSRVVPCGRTDRHTILVDLQLDAQNSYLFTFFFVAVALRPNAGHGLLILEVSRSHTKTHRSRQDSSGRVISSSQRPLPDKTRHLQQTNIHDPGGIRTHDLSRRAAADLRLRPRGHWDRRKMIIRVVNTARYAA